MKNFNGEQSYPVIDGHAHLAEMGDYREVIDEARKAGVRAILAVGMNLDSNRRTLRIAAENPDYVYPAIGYHPWSLRFIDVEETLTFIEDHITEVIALGEVGIDYGAKVDDSMQEAVFSAIVAMARRHNKTLILHGLHSYGKVLSLLRSKSITKAVFHWYADSVDLLQQIIEAGYFVSATPALLYSRAHREAIRATPIEQILLESDCPEKYRDFISRSRPRDVHIALREVARLKGMPLSDVCLRTSENAIRLFGITGIQLDVSDRNRNT